MHIQVGAHVKIKNKAATKMKWTKPVGIPVVYAQLIAQLLAEDLHGEQNSGHEALRRQSYARQVLDAAGKEIKQYKGPSTAFRSKILTPILQRYRRGTPDGYTPTIRTAVSGDEDVAPTLTDATQFYLSEDPVDPAHIPFYR